MRDTFAGLDRAWKADGKIWYITIDDRWIVPEGVESEVLWQGEQVQVRSLGAEESVAQNGRTPMWTVALEIVPSSLVH